ncbi:hypothetical protein PSTT_04574, partial [Puccinia striiformis]
RLTKIIINLTKPRKKLIRTTRRLNFHQTNKEFDQQDYFGRGPWTSTHKHVTRELEKNFPEVAHCITNKKVKSKLSQGFKRDYNAFLALNNASGFGWDNITGVATASAEVWDCYLVVCISCLLSFCEFY